MPETGGGFLFVNAPAAHRTPRISPQKWEEHKGEIVRLYRSLNLSEVVAQMGARHDFHATEPQYVYQLKKWGIKKQGVTKPASPAPLPQHDLHTHSTDAPSQGGALKRGRAAARVDNISISSDDSALTRPPRKRHEQDAHMPSAPDSPAREHSESDLEVEMRLSEQNSSDTFSEHSPSPRSSRPVTSSGHVKAFPLPFEKQITIFSPTLASSLSSNDMSNFKKVHVDAAKLLQKFARGPPSVGTWNKATMARPSMTEFSASFQLLSAPGGGSARESLSSLMERPERATACGNDAPVAISSLKEMDIDMKTVSKPTDPPDPPAIVHGETGCAIPTPATPSLAASTAAGQTIVAGSSATTTSATQVSATSTLPAHTLSLPIRAVESRASWAAQIARGGHSTPRATAARPALGKAAEAAAEVAAEAAPDHSILSSGPTTTSASDAPPPYQPYREVIASIQPLPPTVQWDFRLPIVQLDAGEDEFGIEEGRSKPFSARRLVSALQQNGMPSSRLRHYLSFFSATTLRERINEYVCGYPAIFYIAATHDPALLRAWVENGADVNATDPFRRIPLLAFATLMGYTSGIDSTGVVVELLSLGADVSTIPRPFFSPYIDDPDDKLPLPQGANPLREPKTSWCVEWMHLMLAHQVNLTQRYFLEKATKDQGPTDRQLQVAQLHGATPLLGVSSFLIGQTSAARMVTQKLLAHMALPRSKPLVMVFAGPSGHGKTELARRMGQLLSLEMECVDCTEMKHETDLFGAKKPYIGYDVGSPLNNFLARLNGRRSIVFLDEFEKTTPEVKNALLIPFDEGIHIDRRSRMSIDCTQTIWIIATNAVDNIVLDFCDAHKDILDDDDPIRQMQLANEASTRMRKQLKTEFGNPLTGRITAVIPFLPFSPGEAAVVAHKYILELKAKVRQSIRASGRQLVGNILLEIRRDGAVCSTLAAEGYDSDHGARSLKAVVDSRIEDELVKAYLDEDGQIQDRQPLVRYVVDLTRGRSITVFKVGVVE
ncbi:hypothetical protein B0T14DRAFT_563862 [Immersiella caudata]|uniref:Uncharacterized protein n=1 Tax=Immersiella caudata TaxID=314043 RepID=A0AA39WW87_9PEZI|nr:hypothetical protein B0T14DRAFT_563862 [Immersiella caudata]